MSNSRWGSTTKLAKCRDCDAPILFLKTSRGKSCPVEPESVMEYYDGIEIDELPLFNPSVHTFHFKVCPHKEGALIT